MCTNVACIGRIAGIQFMMLVSIIIAVLKTLWGVIDTGQHSIVFKECNVL